MRKEQFITLVENRLGTVLQTLGFMLQGSCWTRVRGVFIYCVDLQIRSDQGSCCLNLGEHLAFLPCAGSRAAFEILTCSTVDCEIKTRLAPNDLTDYWWYFASGTNGVEDLVNCFQVIGIGFFNRYQDFPNPFTTISVESIGSEVAISLLPNMTKVRRVLLMATIYDYLNDATNAIKWAKFGKDNCGVATGPKMAFRELLRKHNVAPD